MVNNQSVPLQIKNNQSISVKSIPVFSYFEFCQILNDRFLCESVHCVNYFVFPEKDRFIFICVLADDQKHLLEVLAHQAASHGPVSLESLTVSIPALHLFEREMMERHGIQFRNHPWPKPVRASHKKNPYPFYTIQSPELHEVGVGPIHAGIIEPGHFRFLCHGEIVLHLEIQLGYQHRGLEELMIQKKRILERMLLAECIAGDTAVGHGLAFAQAMESLGQIEIEPALHLERSIALELERIAIHTGDLSALCTDVAYQLGTSVYGVLRTPLINFMQFWCGNRLGKNMIRAGGTWNPLTPALIHRFIQTLDDYEWRFDEISKRAFSLAGIENRFENIGTVSHQQCLKIGTVGMAARMAGVYRDVRVSHPFAGFDLHPYDSVLLEHGDVYARFQLRQLEVKKSIAYIRKALDDKLLSKEVALNPPLQEIELRPSSLVVSMTEGWRGEICHTAITDEKGSLRLYKMKDPSMHNWKALELSLRDLEISDFPINNKSYNLSYCGHDL